MNRALTPDMERFIASKFLPADRDTARNLCERAVIHDGSSASPRLVRCALVAGAGSLEKLRAEIEQLKIDYRDVIVSGEYASRNAELSRVRDLDQPIPDGDL